MIPILTPTHHWVCPNCTVESVTHEAQPHTRFHRCAGLHGLAAPLVEKGIKVDVRPVEREDYIGTDRVQMHEGRPIMAVVTERPDGMDTAVFAPAATGGR